MKKIHWFTLQCIIPSGEIEVTVTNPEVVRQVTKVLKLQVGEHVVLKTDQTAFEGVLSHVDRNELVVSELVEKVRSESYKKISLFFCIPKKDKFELILEKCTEIGITDFYPVISDRTVKTNINIERSEKIIQEASEQAQRIDTPVLHAIQSIDDIVREYRPAVFDVDGETFKREENKAIQNILIGPEGGFTLRELELFRDTRLDIFKIGETVLKTETAAILVSGLVVLE